MKYNDAIKQLQAKQLKSVYLITGEELYLAENYLKKLLTLLYPQTMKKLFNISIVHLIQKLFYKH